MQIFHYYAKYNAHGKISCFSKLSYNKDILQHLRCNALLTVALKGLSYGVKVEACKPSRTKIVKIELLCWNFVVSHDDDNISKTFKVIDSDKMIRGFGLKILQR